MPFNDSNELKRKTISEEDVKYLTKLSNEIKVIEAREREIIEKQLKD